MALLYLVLLSDTNTLHTKLFKYRVLSFVFSRVVFRWKVCARVYMRACVCAVAGSPCERNLTLIVSCHHKQEWFTV
jgi:hypothetical protein